MTRGLEKARSVTAPTIATPMEAALRPELPRWLPPLLILVQLSVHFIDRDVYDRYIESAERPGRERNGHHLRPRGNRRGARLSPAPPSAPSSARSVWIALVGLGTFYFGGEEFGWGQHLGRWGTPEPLACDQRSGRDQYPQHLELVPSEDASAVRAVGAVRRHLLCRVAGADAGPPSAAGRLTLMVLANLGVHSGLGAGDSDPHVRAAERLVQRADPASLGDPRV